MTTQLPTKPAPESRAPAGLNLRADTNVFDFEPDLITTESRAPHHDDAMRIWLYEHRIEHRCLFLPTRLKPISHLYLEGRECKSHVAFRCETAELNWLATPQVRHSKISGRQLKKAGVEISR